MQRVANRLNDEWVDLQDDKGEKGLPGGGTGGVRPAPPVDRDGTAPAGTSAPRRRETSGASSTPTVTASSRSS